MQYIFLVLLLPPVFFYLSRRLAETGLFSPFHSFWLSYVAVLVFQPLKELASFQLWVGDEVILKTVLMSLVVGVTVIAGCGMRSACTAAGRVPKIRVALSSADAGFIAAGLLAIAVAAEVALASQAGGWASLLSASRLSINSEVSAYLYQLPDLSLLGILFLAAWRYRTNTLVSVVATWMLSALVFTWYAYIGSRSRVMLLVVNLLIAKYSGRRVTRIPMQAVAAVALLLPLMALIGAYRSYFYNGKVNLDLATVDPIEALSGSMGSYSAFDGGGFPKTATEYFMVASVARYVPDEVDFDYGYMLLEVLTRGVPRYLWPGKIYPDSQSWDRFHQVARTTEFFNNAGYLAGPAAPLPAKWFFMLGWPGLIIGGLYTGWLLRFLEEYTNRHEGVAGMVCNGVFFMTGFAEMNNPFTWLYVTVPFLLIPSTVMMFVIQTVKRKSQRDRRQLGRGSGLRSVMNKRPGRGESAQRA